MIRAAQTCDDSSGGGSGGGGGDSGGGDGKWLPPACENSGEGFVVHLSAAFVEVIGYITQR